MDRTVATAGRPGRRWRLGGSAPVRPELVCSPRLTGVAGLAASPRQRAEPSPMATRVLKTVRYRLHSTSAREHAALHRPRQCDPGGTATVRVASFGYDRQRPCLARRRQDCKRLPRVRDSRTANTTFFRRRSICMPYTQEQQPDGRPEPGNHVAERRRAGRASAEEDAAQPDARDAHAPPRPADPPGAAGGGRAYRPPQGPRSDVVEPLISRHAHSVERATPNDRQRPFWACGETGHVELSGQLRGPARMRAASGCGPRRFRCRDGTRPDTRAYLARRATSEGGMRAGRERAGRTRRRRVTHRLRQLFFDCPHLVLEIGERADATAVRVAHSVVEQAAAGDAPAGSSKRRGWTSRRRRAPIVADVSIQTTTSSR